MRTIRAFLKSFSDPHTYDLRTNLHAWFGLLWGLPIPFYYLLLTHGEPSTGIAHAVESVWMRAFFVAHPILFGLLFGALGTMRWRLEQENERLIQELRAQAWVDPLTGLYNRRYVMEEFKNILKRRIRSGEPVRAVLFDLDGFKAVNDQQGHLAGDQVLQKAAAALRSAIRQGDLLGRFGGDEFLLVAIGDLASVQAIIGRCQLAVQGATGLTISAGVAEVMTPGEPPEALISRADVDLAASKQVSYESKGLHRRGSGELDDKR
ncbi:MAG TPA: GGDEF domain-containing protein [Planctomycetota bacterium]|nr:GGDEF domain-containing protein [Planctomycetota bacterium]